MTRVVLAGALLFALLTGCGSGSSADQTVVVYAAASLRGPFTDIGEQFEDANPGASVEFSFAGSSDLVTQLTQGARADVFASADVTSMDKAAEAGLLESAPVNFASNTLTIAVAPGNPKAIASLRDLTRPDIAVVVCAPQVPCGAATRRVEQAAGVELSPVSEESSVTDVLNKVTSGQADAGLVYVTDAIDAKDKATAVAFPEARGAANTYPIAVLEQAENPELATRFVDAVTGELGQRVLAGAGFKTP